MGATRVLYAWVPSSPTDLIREVLDWLDMYLGPLDTGGDPSRLRIAESGFGREPPRMWRSSLFFGGPDHSTGATFRIVAL
jgi:hypothetical protein